MRLDVPASTLRFYDKEGLLPFVERLPGGIRMFQDTDLEWLQITGCMKKAGMSIRDIRQYIEQAQRGDDTIVLRLVILHRQREVLLGWLSAFCVLYCIVYDGENIVLCDGLLEAAAKQRFVQAVCCCGGPCGNRRRGLRRCI